jgi:hypothetical protein
MSKTLALFLCIAIIVFALGIISGALAQTETETVTTDNYLPSMEGFEGDGGTTSGAGEIGCAEGEFCTSGHFYGAQETGGTFSYEFDFEDQMTIEDINRGFQMDYSVDVESHSSNATVPSCNGNVLRSFDCRDIVNLTVSLFSANETLEYTFEDEFELDFAGDRTFSFEEAIPENEFTELTGGVDLFGIDAGFPVYFFGPRFSNPSLTTTFDVVTFIETQVVELIEQIELTASPIVEIQVDLAPPPPDPEVTQAENEVEDEFDDEFGDDFDYEVSPVSDYDSGGTSSSGSDPFSSNAQQEQQEVELEIEIQVEQEIQAELELEPEPEPEINVEVAPEPEPEPEMEDVAETEEVEEPEEPTEQEADADSEEGSSDTESAESSDESGEEETETAETEESEEAEEPDAKPKVVVKKSVKEKIAKRILKKMGSSGRYDSTNQIKTLVVMQILGDSKTFFETSTALQDTEGFFSDDAIPDGLIDENNFAQYLLFGGSDAKHEAMVNSQYQ